MSSRGLSPGWSIVLFVVGGFAVGAVVGALVGGLATYWYIDPPWSRPPAGTSTVQPLRESIAGLSAFVVAVLCAPFVGALAAAVSGIAAWLHLRREPVEQSSHPQPPHVH